MNDIAFYEININLLNSILKTYLAFNYKKKLRIIKLYFFDKISK